MGRKEAGGGRSGIRRHRDWLRQALRDYDHALRSLQGGHYEWACFAAQQAAEKAVKALLQYRGVDAWGHSVTFLLQALPPDTPVPESIRQAAMELDRHYIPPRYPDAHPQGAPLDYYSAKSARAACDLAKEVLDFARTHLPGS